ncbi:DUF4376 domain-containing protein [Salmonella enterica subsp. enterica serovar Enteritidis]|nr:DUF4376 domain-containing protein [Salmonella enterica subsp. enterica serovar Enteritidis]
MMHLKNIVAGNPKTPDQYQLTKKFGVVWLFDEDGKNWYEEQKKFSADSLKIAYDKNNIIVDINKDVSAINPEGCSVVELPDITANRRADISGRWGFDGTNIIDLMTPEKAREHKNHEIDAWRNRQENGSVTFTWNNHSWDASKAAQDRLAPVLVVAKSGQLPEGFFWTDANNEDIPVTVDDLTAIDAGMTQAMVNMGWKIHERQREMKKEIDELMQVSDILNYSVGWPDDNGN